MAFAWTQGYEIGGFNIFWMDVADRKPIQLTKDSGVNENPWWAPDGLHIVYTSRRGTKTQIFSMLADGNGFASSPVRAITCSRCGLRRFSNSRLFLSVREFGEISSCNRCRPSG